MAKMRETAESAKAKLAVETAASKPLAAYSLKMMGIISIIITKTKAELSTS